MSSEKRDTFSFSISLYLAAIHLRKEGYLGRPEIDN